MAGLVEIIERSSKLMNLAEVVGDQVTKRVGRWCMEPASYTMCLSNRTTCCSFKSEPVLRPIELSTTWTECAADMPNK